jgi:hypothetical protein
MHARPLGSEVQQIRMGPPDSPVNLHSKCKCSPNIFSILTRHLFSHFQSQVFRVCLKSFILTTCTLLGVLNGVIVTSQITVRSGSNSGGGNTFFKV